MISCFFDLCVLLLLSTAEVGWVVGVVGQLLLLQLLLPPPLCHRLLSQLPVCLFLLVSAGGSEQVAYSHRTRYAEYACDDSSDGRSLIAVGCATSIIFRSTTRVTDCCSRTGHQRRWVD